MFMATNRQSFQFGMDIITLYGSSVYCLWRQWQCTDMKRNSQVHASVNLTQFSFLTKSVRTKLVRVPWLLHA